MDEKRVVKVIILLVIVVVVSNFGFISAAPSCSASWTGFSCVADTLCSPDPYNCWSELMTWNGVDCDWGDPFGCFESDCFCQCGVTSSDPICEQYYSPPPSSCPDECPVPAEPWVYRNYTIDSWNNCIVSSTGTCSQSLNCQTTFSCGNLICAPESTDNLADGVKWVWKDLTNPNYDENTNVGTFLSFSGAPGDFIFLAPASTVNCEDGKDNDCDGLVDCRDPDCMYKSYCACLDSDGDHYGIEPVSSNCNSLYPDCNDTNANVYPGAPEICDQIDNQCWYDAQGGIDEGYGEIDEGCVYCNDIDNDGYDDCNIGEYQDDGLQIDCNDGNPAINPGATEVKCNGIDDDCNGWDYCPPCTDEDGDAFSLEANPTTECNNKCLGGIYPCFGGGDCQDTPEGADGILGTSDDGGRIYPVLLNPYEVCGDAIDHNCDGLDPACTCNLTSTSWTEQLVEGGTYAHINTWGTNCEGISLTLELYEDDPSDDDLVINFSLASLFFLGYSIPFAMPWNYFADQYAPGEPTDDDDDGNWGPSDIADRTYYYKIYVSGNPGEVVQSLLLNVTKPNIIYTCSEQSGFLCGDTECCNDTIYPATDGLCCASSCISSEQNCDGKECDFPEGIQKTDACGNLYTCGSCEVGQSCMPDETCCVPNCTDKECGSDGCGGSCGTCNPGEVCAFDSICVTDDDCYLFNASWNTSTALVGQIVALEIYGTSGAWCSGKAVNTQVFEDDGIFGSDIVAEPNTIYFNGEYARGTWETIYVSDASGDPEYYFKAIITGQETTTKEYNGNKLLTVSSPECSGIVSCDDYQTPTECSANVCPGVIAWHENAENSDGNSLVCGSDDDCETQNTWTSCGCAWDETERCGFVYSDFICSEDTCDGVSRDPGEECDGNDLDGYTVQCSSFGLNGGSNVACGPDCTFDLSGCGISCNINGVVDFGSELCEPGNFTKDPLLNDGPLWTCSDFDNYDSGYLTCTNCMINTSQCSWSQENKDSIGSCFRKQNNSIGCDEEPIGFYISSWEGKWTWGHSAMLYSECESISGNINDCTLVEGVGYYYDPNDRKDSCVRGGETVIECPAESLLSFFNYETLIVSLVVILGIYLGLQLKKAK